jgi:hypothetical protein
MRLLSEMMKKLPAFHFIVKGIIFRVRLMNYIIIMEKTACTFLITMENQGVPTDTEAVNASCECCEF